MCGGQARAANLSPGPPPPGFDVCSRAFTAPDCRKVRAVEYRRSFMQVNGLATTVDASTAVMIFTG